MKKGKIRSLIIAVVLIVTLYYFLPLVVQQLPSFWTEKRLKLGLDLQGGSQIQLEVDFTGLELTQKEREDAVKTALEIIRNRIDQFGVSEPSIQRVGNTNRIAIQLPGLRDAGRAKELIGKTALLEFKLLADSDQIQETYQVLDKYLDENVDRFNYLEKFVDVEVSEVTDILEADVEDTTAAESNRIFTKLTTSQQEYPMTIDFQNIALFKTLLKDEEFLNQIPEGLQVAVGKEDKNDIYAPRPVYVLYEKAEITGQYLENASVKIGQGYDPKTSGKPYIALKFNKPGAKMFSNITGQNIKKRLAIVLDNVVYVAPVIEDKIPNGEARITGNFTIEESNDLVIVLNAGNLPAPVSVIEERT
ncbi:MAG: protein translocase subunit SecD, partial [Candidatus Cloacimonetes bacterium]|nr:protein translocase subunit SecD [Candidatus Cloacimonadota bacterium]